MEQQGNGKPAPVVSFVVDEATEFLLKAEPNPHATVKQRSGNDEASRRILSVEVDEAAEFTLKALPSGCESSESAPSQAEKRESPGQ